MLYRKLDEEFVKKLTNSTQLESGFNTVIFPVVLVSEGTISLQAAQIMEYFTLGGNHLRTALHEKLKSGEAEAMLYRKLDGDIMKKLANLT